MRSEGGATTSLVERLLRIGEVAELTGTTPRTIRYYEEIGLLPGAADRVQGKHRVYTDADVERVREIVRLRDLLGLSLEQLSRLLEAESAREELRSQFREAEDPASQLRILQQALGHLSDQLELVRGRRRELEQLEAELVRRRRAIGRRLEEIQP